MRVGGARVRDLDQVNVPDPMLQEICRLRERIRALEKKVGELEKDDTV